MAEGERLGSAVTSACLERRKWVYSVMRFKIKKSARWVWGYATPPALFGEKVQKINIPVISAILCK